MKSNEGFSLVELIIVIAITAILVGVIALAVIPNLERSKESKDISTIDTACHALAVAVANASDKAGNGKITIKDGKTADAGLVLDLVKEQIDIESLKFSSAKCADEPLVLEWKTENGKNVVRAFAGNGNIQGDYLKGSEDEKKFLKVVGAEVE